MPLVGFEPSFPAFEPVKTDQAILTVKNDVDFIKYIN
jgi:hypothetical protein